VIATGDKSMKFFLLSLMLLTSFYANAKDIEYKVDGKIFEAYLLKKSDKAPLVFIIHDWDGIGEYEKQRAKMFYDLGYSVFAIDMYGKGIRPQAVEKKMAMTKSLYSNRSKMRGLMNAALKEAKKHGLNVKNSVAIGYCFGGTSILEWAKSGAALKGFVSLHGNLGIKEKETYKNVKSNILILHGTADKVVPMNDFAALAEHLESLNIKHEMITYSGAPHAFSVFGSERYRKDADQKSWARLVEYLKENL
jgi:dienelactone hydrolase